jgi:uncharacterized protein
MSHIAIFLIKFYQKFISKYILIGKHCRFYPTCSQYALLAYEKYGFFKGSFLSLKRILKCNPFHKGGYDPLI